MLKELAYRHVCFLWIQRMKELSDPHANAYVDYNPVECKHCAICCVGACCPQNPSNLIRGQHIPPRQCTYNVTLRRVRSTIVAVEKQRVLHDLRVCVYL